MKLALIAAAASLLACSTSALAASTVSVATDPNAPTSNFGTPGNTATAGYTITLGDSGTAVTGIIQQTGGNAAGPFANLYFDLDPATRPGSDLGFQLGGSTVNAFIPSTGQSTVVDPSLYTFSSMPSGGLYTLNFSLNNSLFTSPIAGLTYNPAQTFQPTVRLNLSQSLSYSVAGGQANYGDARLGTAVVSSVAGAVPEPATWAMMLLGFGGMGSAMRRDRRRSAKRIAQVA